LKNNLTLAFPSTSKLQNKIVIAKRMLLVRSAIAEQYSFGDFTYIQAKKIKEESVDVVCQHGRYSREDVESLIGKDGLTVTILRDPIEQFSSMWAFYNYSGKTHMSLETWLTHNHR